MNETIMWVGLCLIIFGLLYFGMGYTLPETCGNGDCRSAKMFYYVTGFIASLGLLIFLFGLSIPDELSKRMKK